MTATRNPSVLQSAFERTPDVLTAADLMALRRMCRTQPVRSDRNVREYIAELTRSGMAHREAKRQRKGRGTDVDAPQCNVA
jgi:hypothetical protein